MAENQIKQILRDLEDAGTNLSTIAREHDCTPQFASRALRETNMPIGAAKAAQIRAAIADKLGRDPWEEQSQAPDTAG